MSFLRRLYKAALLTALMTVFSAMVVIPVAAALPAGSTLVFDRGLPSANLNEAAGANRSNISLGDTEFIEFPGDDFTIGNLGEVWTVDRVRLWNTAGPTNDPDYRLGDDFKNIALHGSLVGNSLQLLSSGNLEIGSDINSNTNITHTKITYADLSLFQIGPDEYANLWQTDYDNLNWQVMGGQLYQFGQNGVPVADTVWYNHASNRNLSGSPQTGADDKFRSFKASDPNFLAILDSSSFWDKSTDINVQIWARKMSTDGGTVNQTCTIKKTGKKSKNVCVNISKNILRIKINQTSNITNDIRGYATSGKNTINGTGGTIKTGNATVNITVNNSVNRSRIIIGR
ncbi:MAG: hypothetical protein UV73_C0012G0007 [Candidatus Gottesmanbacteria bacterium GW2011_GWA2_43_14]|uniref:Uncharacterized protein n=1 Tax=Candidatus Gottesmanbacteria bacterium GW2011_GWA2_43_14 TaxID=1618443 RepID=A0A0G1DEC6_9BACT|nr:MAG: hypothetical protein UV73_C0012G0007 [Candidatus Gottesmanbacteria bacterium GW2011_GWA2_43_14]